MTPDPEPGRSLLAVSPGVKRLDRNLEVGGQFVDIDQAVVVFHHAILQTTLSTESKCPFSCLRLVSPGPSQIPEAAVRGSRAVIAG
jgi:hypothetical protein